MHDLVPGQWAVLAVVDEAVTHGFAVARELGADGSVGAVWTVKRPLVYRALDILADAELTEPAGVEPSTSGPPRELVRATPAGAAAVGGWLRAPVDHVRDARSELLLKLLFLHRRGSDPAPLVRAQAATFTRTLRALEDQLRGAEGFDRTALLWRREATTASLRFLDAL